MDAMPDTPNNQRRPAGQGTNAPRPRMTPWIVIALAITALLAFNQFSAGSRNEISYSDFQAAVNANTRCPRTSRSTRRSPITWTPTT
jgi:hypothetical protein